MYNQTIINKLRHPNPYCMMFLYYRHYAHCIRCSLDNRWKVTLGRELSILSARVRNGHTTDQATVTHGDNCFFKIEHQILQGACTTEA